MASQKTQKRYQETRTEKLLTTEIELLSSLCEALGSIAFKKMLKGTPINMMIESKPQILINPFLAGDEIFQEAPAKKLNTETMSELQLITMEAAKETPEVLLQKINKLF